MGDMKLNAEVLLRIEGHEELHSIGTIDVPINITFGSKPGPKPGYRGGAINIVQVDTDGLTRNVEAVAKRATDTLRAHGI